MKLLNTLKFGVSFKQLLNISYVFYLTENPPFFNTIIDLFSFGNN